MKVFKRIKWSYVVLSAMFLLLGIYPVSLYTSPSPRD